MLLVMSSNESAAVSAELSDDPTGASVDKVDAGSESGRDDEAKDDANLAQKVGGSSTNSGEVEVDDDVALTFPQRVGSLVFVDDRSCVGSSRLALVVVLARALFSCEGGSQDVYDPCLLNVRY